MRFLTTPLDRAPARERTTRAPVLRSVTSDGSALSVYTATYDAAGVRHEVA